MADILLNKVVNSEIELTLLIKWLLKTDRKEQYFEEIKDCKCSQIDFLTYFLNFVHEEIPCQNKCGDTPQKNTLKRIQLTENGETLSQKRVNIVTSDISKPSVSSALNKTIENEISSTSLNVSQSSNVNESQVTSTPKVTKLQPNCSVANGYLSPISPLYKGQNHFSTPKVGRQRNTSQKSSEKLSSLCLGDFIVHKKSSIKKKSSRSLLKEENNDETSRRIKPTCLNQLDSNTSFQRTENSFNNFQDTKELSVESLNHSRNFLAEERLKILTRKNSGDNLTSTKKIGNFTNSRTEIEPNITCVSNKMHVNVLVDIYVNILNNNLVLNVNSEIYFLISLLVSKQFGFKESFKDSSSEDFNVGVDFLNDDDRSMLSVSKCENVNINSTDLFDTIHNIVYFAVKCLESLIDILKYYDRSTLKLLSSNHRLKSFGAGFSEKLSKIAEDKRDRTVELREEGNFQANVCFNLDTDNRSNFPSDSSFHSFRKQRDLFYDILRIWENNHSLSGWSFSVALGGKIRALFSLQGESANFMHFSRLFKAQLLSTCGKKEKDEGLSQNQLPFLTSLPNIDADKLNRLKCRLVTKQSMNGINPFPTFTGYQEFFRDFILVAGNYAFNKHLCDILVVEILELNDSNFFCNDLEETGTIDRAMRKAFVDCLRLLRTLAKFLGFIESLPYKSECSNYTEIFLATQLNVRCKTTPSFDVKRVLDKSIEDKNVVLMIPWVTDYLAMLDYVTLRLPYYKSVHRILFELYKRCEIGPNQHQNNYNSSAVKFCLGWLFEMPHFPDSEYFNYCLNPGKDLSVDKQYKSVKSTNKSLDDWDIVDQDILYICCPHLEGVKKLLSSNILNSNVTVKHITPVTAVRSSDEIVKKRLEQQLEEAFFNGQSVSVRKTVEFVSERVASTCVKHICSVVVPSFKSKVLEEVRKFLSSWKEDSRMLLPACDKSQKNTLKLKLNQIAQTNLKSLKEKCESELTNIANERIKCAIDSLLAVDVLPQTKDVCNTITTKICIERVREWVNSHVTASIFNKELENELQKALESKAAKDRPIFMLPPGGSDKKHNEDTLSAFHLLEKLKVSSIDILTDPVQISEDFVTNLLKQSYETINERCDVNESALTYICSLLVDFALLLIAHKPQLMNDVEILENFVMIWRCLGIKADNLFKNLLCPRNTMLFAQSDNAALSWKVFANFTAYLIKENLLSCEAFERQYTGFFKKDWDQGSLNNFTAFLHTFVDCYKQYGGSTDKFTMLIDFLSDFCSDL